MITRSPGSVDPRKHESGPGFVRAVACPMCMHTRCGPDCGCDCDTPNEDDEATPRSPGLA